MILQGDKGHKLETSVIIKVKQTPVTKKVKQTPVIIKVKQTPVKIQGETDTS